MQNAIINSPLGAIKIEGSELGVSNVQFVQEDVIFKNILNLPKPIKETICQLEEYFEHKRTRFDLHLNPQGTVFQKKVWNTLSTIPFGKTVSYLDIAKKLGDPKVIRAAASANGKNPIAIIIPCHRVIGSDGSLTGYAGGLPRKKWLLEHESPVTQTALF